MINNTKFTNVTKTDTSVTITKTGVRTNSKKKKNTTATQSTVPGHHWLVRTMPVLAV
jgi:hypothetical protein